LRNFLANENFPLASVIKLREADHDVAAVVEDSPGATDPEVLARAHRECRIIMTFDRDYGELIYRRRLSAPPGLVYFRFIPKNPLEPAEYLLRLLCFEDISLKNKFTVVERDKVRQRPLRTDHLQQLQST